MRQLSAREQTAIQTYTLKRLLSEAMAASPGKATLIDGPALINQLSRYTAKQQERLLGPGVAADLRELGNDLQFLFPKQGIQYGTSQSEVSVTSKSFFNPLALHKRLTWYVSAYITDQPQVLHWFADIHRADPALFRALIPGFGSWIVNSATSGPGHGRAQTPGTNRTGPLPPSPQPGEGGGGSGTGGPQ